MEASVIEKEGPSFSLIDWDQQKEITHALDRYESVVHFFPNAIVNGNREINERFSGVLSGIKWELCPEMA